MAYRNTRDEDTNEAYDRLRRDLRAGTPRGAYVFYGEERYLLDDSVKKLRAMIPEETAEFNYHRLDGKRFDADGFAAAVDALPVFAERTLIEVRDANFGKMGEDAREAILAVLRDVPEYATVVFLCPEGAAPDGRTKFVKELSKLTETVEFRRLTEQRQRDWVTRAFSVEGKRVTREAVERFVELTGGSMTNMKTEVEKLVTYVQGDAVTLRDVELLVTPVSDARTWNFTDAVIALKGDEAFERMGEILRTPGMSAYSVIYSLASVTRQLMMANICAPKGVQIREFQDLAGVKTYTAGKNLLAAARKIPLERSARAAALCCETILRLNSTGEDEGGAARELTARVLLTLGARA